MPDPAQKLVKALECVWGAAMLLYVKRLQEPLKSLVRLAPGCPAPNFSLQNVAQMHLPTYGCLLTVVTIRKILGYS